MNKSEIQKEYKKISSFLTLLNLTKKDYAPLAFLIFLFTLIPFFIFYPSKYSFVYGWFATFIGLFLSIKWILKTNKLFISSFDSKYNLGLKNKWSIPKDSVKAVQKFKLIELLGENSENQVFIVKIRTQLSEEMKSIKKEVNIANLPLFAVITAIIATLITGVFIQPYIINNPNELKNTVILLIFIYLTFLYGYFAIKNFLEFILNIRYNRTEDLYKLLGDIDLEKSE
jgi:hypothetical protein